MLIFPMAGLSRRFLDAGFTVPKYELKVGDLNLFQQSLTGFERYFKTDVFMFIYLKDVIHEDRIRLWCENMGLQQMLFVPLSGPTTGQAETVYRGLTELGNGYDEEPLIIFNIDTIYRDFRKPKSDCINFIDVTVMDGEHWSFIEVDPCQPNLVKNVEEKIRISDKCSVGLYGFENIKTFRLLYEKFFANHDASHEKYIAPMYRQLINDDINVYYREFDKKKFEFLGTPQEYFDFVKKI